MLKVKGHFELMDKVSPSFFCEVYAKVDLILVRMKT